MRFSFFRKRQSQADLKSPASYWSNNYESDTDSDDDNDSWETDSDASMDYAERYFINLGESIQVLMSKGLGKGILENAREKISRIADSKQVFFDVKKRVDDFNFDSVNSLLEEGESIVYKSEESIPIQRIIRSVQKSLDAQKFKAFDINNVFQTACSCTSVKDYLDDWSDDLGSKCDTNESKNDIKQRNIILTYPLAIGSFDVNWSECPTPLKDEPIFLQNDSDQDRQVKILENYLKIDCKSYFGARDFGFAQIVPHIHASSSSDSYNGLISGAIKKRKCKRF